MSITPPAKRESDELARAILKDELEPYDSNFRKNLEDFNSHKDCLLSLLFPNYTAQPVSDKHSDVWSRIETIAHKFFAREILRLTATSEADRIARYRDISDASKRARSKIEKSRQPKIQGNVLKQWLDGNADLDHATRVFSDRLNVEVDFGRKIEKTMAALTELELAANQAADAVHRQSGRPEGTSILPRNYISDLESIFQSSTNQVASTENEAFRIFVEAFLVAAGRSQKSARDYVCERLKYERKLTRKKARSRDS